MTDFCHYHPKHALIGVCPFCLNDKLLVVAALQARRHDAVKPSNAGRPNLLAFGSLLNRHDAVKPSNAGRPNLLAFGSLLNRHHSNHRGSRGSDEDGGGRDSQSTSTSLEDSFISIKFEGNGVALWDKSKVSNQEGSLRSVVERSKAPRASMRWRKRIGHLLQMVRWKRSNMANGGSSNVDGLVKVRSKSWMRSLTRRRTCKE